MRNKTRKEGLSLSMEQGLKPGVARVLWALNLEPFRTPLAR